MNKSIVTAAVVAAVVGGFGAYLVTKPPMDGQRTSLGGMSSGGMSSQPEWTDAAWPFPIDQWGQGWAYQCKAADCGVEVNVYLRPKIGLCNCQTGVADAAAIGWGAIRRNRCCRLPSTTVVMSSLPLLSPAMRRSRMNRPCTISST